MTTNISSHELLSIMLSLFFYALLTVRAIPNTYYVSSNPEADYTCIDESNNTCSIHCDEAVTSNTYLGSTFDCGHSKQCNFYCDERRCAENAHIIATNSNNFHVMVGPNGEECMFDAVIQTPQYGNATFDMGNSMKGLAGMMVNAGSNAQNIIITAESTNVTGDDCKGMEIYAASAEYVRISLGDDIEWEDGILECPVITPAINNTPCMLYASNAILMNTHIIADGGIPINLWISPGVTYSGINTVTCNGTTSIAPFETNSECWFTSGLHPLPTYTTNSRSWKKGFSTITFIFAVLMFVFCCCSCLLCYFIYVYQKKQPVQAVLLNIPSKSKNITQPLSPTETTCTNNSGHVLDTYLPSPSPRGPESKPVALSIRIPYVSPPPSAPPSAPPSPQLQPQAPPPPEPIPLRAPDSSFSPSLSGVSGEPERYSKQESHTQLITIPENAEESQESKESDEKIGDIMNSILDQVLDLKEYKSYKMDEVAQHNKVDDLWIVLNNNVYDVTDFWQFHPVNAQYVFKYGGKDATDAFEAAGHSEYAQELADGMKIGELAIQERKYVPRQSSSSVVNWLELESTSLENEIRIKYINVFPVKGCHGIKLDSTNIDESGVYNDRMYVFVDADTNTPINQLKYPKLALIQPKLKNINESEEHQQIELYYFDSKNQQNENIIVPTKCDKDCVMEIEYINSDTKILAYDQGNEISDWITNYLHSCSPITDKNKRFRFCKIMRYNKRYHKDYFSLPFIDKSSQPIKGVLNYSAINIASQESLNELNRRWFEKYKDKNKFDWDTWRVNIVLEGFPSPHFEDFAKYVTIGNSVKLLWNRRRYLCTVPSVDQSNGVQTDEPKAILTRYRNAITLNDTTAKPGKNGLFFGSFFLVKSGGKIRVGDKVIVHQKQFNILRTNRNNSFYGFLKTDKDLQIKTLRQWEKYTLIKKEILTHDVYQLRFALANPAIYASLQHESLRLNVGGHYLLKIPKIDTKLNDKISVIRAYTPVILDDENDETYFDLIVKIYAKGRMTQYFKCMNIGDLIDGKQYYGDIRCIEIGKFQFGDPSRFQVKHHTLNVNYINMICGGTGVAPMMQIIQSIDANKGIDNTKINVLISNKTINDFLLVDKLNEISMNNENIKIYYVVTTRKDAVQNKNDKKGKHLKVTQFGKRIDADFIDKYGFKPSDDCISLLCGPPKMDIAMKENCKQIGFRHTHIHTF